jgi:CII-binding regulator of phage lambda lysogenization HflD
MQTVSTTILQINKEFFWSVFFCLLKIINDPKENTNKYINSFLYMEGKVSSMEGTLTKMDKKISNLHEELWHEKTDSARNIYVLICARCAAQLLPERTQVSNHGVHSQLSTD